MARFVSIDEAMDFSEAVAIASGWSTDDEESE